MDKLKINGKADLFGSIEMPGAKNAALPIMVSSMLSKEELHIRNIPNLFDIKQIKKQHEIVNKIENKKIIDNGNSLSMTVFVTYYLNIKDPQSNILCTNQ